MGQKPNIQFLSFINNVCRELTQNLTTDERTLIKQNISNLLEYGENFLNYLGEICVLNCFMKTGLYSLDRVEHGTKTGKKIDFVFNEKVAGRKHFIEVVNIEIPTEKLSNDQALERHLTTKLTNKLEDTDKSGVTEYTLIPVLWGENSSDTVLAVRDFYRRTNFSIPRVWTPLVYTQLKSDGSTYNKFGDLFACDTI